MTITISVDETSAKIGDTLIYTINVTNTGNVDLENVIVENQKVKPNDTIALLKQGETKTYVKEYVIPQGTIAGDLENIASANTTYNETELKVTAKAVTKVIVDTIDIPEESVPLGDANLPQTGGFPVNDYLVLGSAILAIGLILIKRK